MEQEEIEKVCSEIFDSEPEEWSFRDLSNSYRFSHGERLVWVIDGETDDSLLLFRDEESPWLRLNGSGGLPLLRQLFGGQFDGKLPQDGKAVAELLMEWHAEPRGYLLTREFMTDQEDVLESFIVSDDYGVSALDSLSADPKMQYSAGSWALEFIALDHRGGVSRWSASGQTEPVSLESVSVKEMLPAETFYYPDEF